MTKDRFCALGFALAVTIGFTATGFSQAPAGSAPHDPRIGQVIDALQHVRMMRETALSPDAKWIAWTVGGRGGSKIELAPLENPAAA